MSKDPQDTRFASRTPYVPPRIRTLEEAEVAACLGPVLLSGDFSDLEDVSSSRGYGDKGRPRGGR